MDIVDIVKFWLDYNLGNTTEDRETETYDLVGCHRLRWVQGFDL